MKTPRRNRERISAKSLIDITLKLIEEAGSCRDVNLREVGRVAKCAHTNIYNYFKSLEELFWAAADQALEDLISATGKQLATPAGKRKPLRTFIEVQVQFAQDHPALYRLFWLEPLKGNPPPRILHRMESMRALWLRMLTGKEAEKVSVKDNDWVLPVVHGYFHGELCKLITRKNFAHRSHDNKDKIVANTLRLADVIAKAH